MRTVEMMDTYPATITVDRALLASAVDDIVECAQACTACADACLSEEMVGELRTCIRTNLDCADICEATARVLSRHTGYDANITRTQLQACAQACHSCGDECESHAARHEHCKLCADACRDCEAACRRVLEAIA
ncbi:four-helix bundle copper-binding protein [Ornithinimicrobium murale]|uniref:four-helix bundle copper-binding protein n=1 Tax=Ornithinimicrobium murale TaxID=1050153 RepID=UPI000E0D0783|nr:four-helix bundle copper-binding protein [Ornithinimicrobium murale]